MASRAETEYPRVVVESRAAWRRWLEENHDTAPGAWAVTWKRASGGPYVAAAEVSEEALRVGWVDSLPRTVDAARTRLLCTPRREGSRWSRLNRTRAERMLADGSMHPAGAAAVERARADGTWTALDDVEDLREPPDLRAALDSDPPARRAWDGFPPSARRGILEWILSARRPETRAARVGETARLAARGERANRWPRGGAGGG
jgi:uncharacterized protein YdeI (YjbR/CyaY-like superfamily)